MKLKLALAGALVLGLVTPTLAADNWDRDHSRNEWNDRHDNDRQHDRYDRAAYRPASWKLIGSRNVSIRAERDVIPSFGRDRVQQVKLCVEGQAVRMFDFDVRFRNGGSQSVPVRNVIGAGQCTRNIDLKGDRRDISAISLAYKSAGKRWMRGGATVKVYAR